MADMSLCVMQSQRWNFERGRGEEGPDGMVLVLMEMVGAPSSINVGYRLYIQTFKGQI